MSPGAEAGNSIVFYVNGARREVTDVDVDMSLLEYLRTKEGLTGAKLGCGEGGCGACTVMVSEYIHALDRVEHRTVNGCIFPVAMLDNLAITTIEGVGNRKGGLHPVQKRLIESHGSQCGFCTPGIVMSMFTLLRQRCAEDRTLTERDIEENFDGNLCRCTGYRPILDAYKSFASGSDCCRGENGEGGCPCMPAQTPDGEQANGSGTDVGASDVRQNAGSASTAVSGPKNGIREPANASAPSGDTSQQEPAKEHIFPPELVRRSPTSLHLNGSSGQWFRPTTMSELLAVRQEHPDAKLIAGNTEVGIEKRFKNLRTPVQVALNQIPELLVLRRTDEGFEFGAAVTLAHLQSGIARISAQEGISRCGNLVAVAEQLRWFAGKQIRNVAVVGGNIVTASPISDLNPVWVAARARFLLVSSRSGQARTVEATKFFKGYRAVDMEPDEVLVSVTVPWTEPFEHCWAFKLARRKDDDISIVCAAMRLRLRPDPDADDPRWSIEDVGISYGGVRPMTVAANRTEGALIGVEFSEQTMRVAMDTVAQEIRLEKGVPGGMEEFRSSLVVGFLLKAFLLTAGAVQSRAAELGISGPAWTPEPSESVLQPEKPISRGVQVYGTGPAAEEGHMGRPVGHSAAELQVTGEAVYVDDIPSPPGCLFGALVLSTRAHAHIVGVDFRETLQCPGVHDVVTAKDVLGSNKFGVVLQDELCFAEGEVTCVGQVIAVVLADTPRAARLAVPTVKVEYKALPAVITIEDAIRESSYLVGERTIQAGDIDGAMRDAEHIVHGEVRMGAQEHFYLECNGTLAVPTENDEMTVFSSTQAASTTQLIVSKVLGVPQHKIVTKVKRIGGGFGGKEVRSVFLSAAVCVAAQKSGRPVKVFMDRDVDMMTTGHRHSFYAKYSVAFDGTGRLHGLDAQVYNNAGNTLDLSMSIMDRALYHVENAYRIPNLRATGRVCYTNTPSNTAFRGFGGPQGMMVAENVIDHVASFLKMDPEEVRYRNLYGEGDVTPYGMRLDGCTVRRCWDEVVRTSDISTRKAAVADFNSRNKYRKRGIAAVPTKFGISFTFRTLNQAGALVHLYVDGSVLVTHGGVEMGQGLHVKMSQVAATALGVPMASIYISETATDKVPNQSPSAASASADMYGKAVLDACEQLNARLKPIRQALGNSASWGEVVSAAYHDRVNLSAQGFYKVPDLDQVDLGKNGKGRPFYYFTYGAAVSEVEIDCLSGECEVLRTDIVMDIGRSLNPAIDVGQIEGAFVQGLGWCTMEEIVRGGKTAQAWLPEGLTHTQGPSTYKIPGFRDIPYDFRVSLLKDAPNNKPTIHHSKAVGEPPLFLASSVFFAIRSACGAARMATGIREDEGQRFQLDSPASTERIRMACIDDITLRFADASFRPAGFC